MLEHEVLVSKSGNNDGKKDLVSVALTRHHAVHNAQCTSPTMPDGRPHKDASPSVTVVLTEATGCESLSFQSMDVDTTIMKIKSES